MNLHFVKSSLISNSFFFSAQTLLREWSKYRYGVFPEIGFDNDVRYPSLYKDGNATLNSRGCLQRDPFCPQDLSYDRFAPTKQNLLCHGASAIETILGNQDFKPKQQQKKFVYEAVPTNSSSTTTSTTTEGASSTEEENVTPTYYPVTDVTETSTLKRHRRDEEPTPTTATTQATTPTPTDFVPSTQKIARDPVFN